MVLPVWVFSLFGSILIDHILDLDLLYMGVFRKSSDFLQVPFGSGLRKVSFCTSGSGKSSTGLFRIR